MDDAKFAPAKIGKFGRDGRVPMVVHVMAYEVFKEVFGANKALMNEAKNYRGGFTTRELIGALYARNFPKTEWAARFEEAVKGLEAR